MKREKRNKVSIGFKGIKSKLVVFFGSISLLSSILISVLAITVASDIIIDDSNRSMNYIAKEAAKVQVSRLETERQTLETIVHLDDIVSMNWSLQQPVLNKVLLSSNFIEIGIISIDGMVHYSNGKSYTMEKTNSLWGVLDGKDKAVEFTISQETGELALFQAIPIKSSGKTVGALLGHSEGKILSDMVADVGYGNDGYGYIVNADGTAIAHPNLDLVLTKFNPIEAAKTDSSIKSLSIAFEDILANKEGITSYSYNGGDQYVGYSKLGDSDWTFVLVASKNEILSSVPLLIKSILQISALTLVISIILTYILGNSITKPIIKTVDYAKNISNLNLSENIHNKYLGMKDEVGILANSLQDIINNLRSIIFEINNSTDMLSASSEELTATSQQSANASQEIAKTVEEIADGASQQAKYTEDGFIKANQLGETMNNVQGYISNVNETSNKVTSVVDEGLHEINLLDSITKESMESIKEIYQVVMQTNESSNKIGEASSMIEAIAQQTNLLSLNAAIEAARAGDAGRGFAVVAEEIRKLAEQSQSSTKVINEIVSELQTNINNAVDTMKRVTDITKGQADGVTNNRNKYQLIANAMNESIEAVKLLNSSGDEVDKVRKDLLDVLENLSAIAEENAAASEQASAATEEQTASVEEIASASDSLSSLASNLHALVVKFKL